MVVSSFKTRDDYIGNSFGRLPSEWTLATMRAALRGNDLLLWLLNSTIVTVGAVGISTLIAAAAAYPLALKGWRPSGAIISLLVVLMALPPIVLVVPLFQLVAFNTGQQNTYTAAVVIYTDCCCRSRLPALGCFRTSPTTLEAARVDGAGQLGRSSRSWCTLLAAARFITVVIVQALWAGTRSTRSIFLQASNLRTLMVGVTVSSRADRADVPLTMAGMLWATCRSRALTSRGSGSSSAVYGRGVEGMKMTAVSPLCCASHIAIRATERRTCSF